MAKDKEKKEKEKEQKKAKKDTEKKQKKEAKPKGESKDKPKGKKKEKAKEPEEAKVEVEGSKAELEEVTPPEEPVGTSEKETEELEEGKKEEVKEEEGEEAKPKAAEEEAAEEEEELEIVEEKFYSFNLRKIWSSPREKRTPRAVRFLRDYVARHMKTDEVKISEEANSMLWQRGISKPPRKIRVRAVKDKDGKVIVFPGEGKE